MISEPNPLLVGVKMEINDSKRLEWLLGSLDDTEIAKKLAQIAESWTLGVRYGDYRGGIDWVMEGNGADNEQT